MGMVAWNIMCLSAHKKDLPLRKQVFDLVGQVADMEGLSKEAVCPGTDGHYAAIGIVQRGDDYDGYCAEIGVLSQHAAKLKTCRLGHHQVKQDQVWLFLTRRFHGFGAVIDDDGLMACRQQDRLQKIGRAFIIINNEDFCHNVFCKCLNFLYEIPAIIR